VKLISFIYNIIIISKIGRILYIIIMKLTVNKLIQIYLNNLAVL